MALIAGDRGPFAGGVDIRADILMAAARDGETGGGRTPSFDAPRRRPGVGGCLWNTVYFLYIPAF